jgi:tetratricopeptide (TPR) repeat protein
MIDAEELLRLSLEATRTGRHDVALDCLKRARERAPERADIRHLLGAEYAQIGMHERAEPEFAEALRLEPDRHSARFQFALVQMMRADVPAALQTLAPLLSLPLTDPMQRFGEGLDHLLRDRLEEAAASIESGLALPVLNESLNKDMRMLLDDIRAAKPPRSTGEDESTASHVLLNSYTGKLQ